jgi:hypothetical protein
MVPLTLFFPILFEYVELCTMHVIPMYPVFFFFFVCMFLTCLTLKSFLGSLQNQFFSGFLLETLLLLVVRFLSRHQESVIFMILTDFQVLSMKISSGCSTILVLLIDFGSHFKFH